MISRSRRGSDPRRRALEERQVLDQRLDAGTNWIAEAPVPTTATRWPVRSWSWCHARRVERRALEVVEAGDVGEVGSLSGPGRRDSTSAVTVPARSRVARAARRRPSGASVTSRSKRTMRRRRRSARRTRAGRRGSPAGARRSGSSPGSARRRTSRGATGRRRRSRGRCCPARCRRRRRRARGRRSPRCPPRSRRMAMPRPEKPLPTMATRTWPLVPLWLAAEGGELSTVADTAGSVSTRTPLSGAVPRSCRACDGPCGRRGAERGRGPPAARA